MRMHRDADTSVHSTELWTKKKHFHGVIGQIFNLRDKK